MDYDRIGASRSAYDDLLRELKSDFRTEAELRQAEHLLAERIAAVARALQNPVI